MLLSSKYQLKDSLMYRCYNWMVVFCCVALLAEWSCIDNEIKFTQDDISLAQDEVTRFSKVLIWHVIIIDSVGHNYLLVDSLWIYSSVKECIMIVLQKYIT